MLTRRDRVIQAVRHEPTDFVPYNFHAVPSVVEKLRQHYGLCDAEAVHEFIGNHIVKVGSDFNYDPWSPQVGRVKLNLSGGPVYTDLDQHGGLHRDEFGCVWDRRGGMPTPVSSPLEENPDLDRYQFPDPRRPGRFDAARTMAEPYRGRVFLFGKLGMCLFERAWGIRGMTSLLTDIGAQPEFVEELLDRILYEWNLPIIEQQLALGLDGFYFGDDWGTKTSLMISPAMWRRLIKPRMAIMYQRCRQAGLIVGQHTDGAVGEIIPDLIEIGLQVFNPLSPTLMNPRTYKEKYGDRLAFYGGIDVERTLPFGSPQDVRQEIRQMAALMGKGGGYILQSSHTILDSFPFENILAYVEEVRTMAGLT